MTIDKILDGEKLTVKLEGRLDTLTAPEFEEELSAALPDVTELIFDFKGLTYISSAGLRVLLSAQKLMDKQGSMKITGVSAAIMDIFDLTGFSDIMTIEG